MKLRKSKLDEMQEWKVTELESKGLRIMIPALFAAEMVQLMFCEDPGQCLWELCILVGMCVYVAAGYLKIGVWSRYGNGSIKSCLVICVLGAVFVGVFVWISGLLYGPLYTVTADILFFSGASLVTYTAGGIILWVLYRKRRQKLDLGADQTLAKQAGICGETLKAIETGAYNPSIRLCRAICKAKGKTLDELFGNGHET